MFCARFDCDAIVTDTDIAIGNADKPARIRVNTIVVG